MKAKEYAKIFEDAPTFETLTWIANSFIYEIKELVKSRRCGTSAAIFAVFDEQERKWKALAAMIDGFKPEGFSNLIAAEFPDVHRRWKAQK